MIGPFQGPRRPQAPRTGQPPYKMGCIPGPPPVAPPHEGQPPYKMGLIPGPVPPPHEFQDLSDLIERARFQAADTNHDGILSKDEFVNSMRRQRGPLAAEAAAIAFEQSDANGDGRLSRREVVLAGAFAEAERVLQALQRLFRPRAI